MELVEAPRFIICMSKSRRRRKFLRQKECQLRNGKFRNLIKNYSNLKYVFGTEETSKHFLLLTTIFINILVLQSIKKIWKHFRKNFIKHDRLQKLIHPFQHKDCTTVPEDLLKSLFLPLAISSDPLRHHSSPPNCTQMCNCVRSVYFWAF